MNLFGCCSNGIQSCFIVLINLYLVLLFLKNRANFFLCAQTINLGFFLFFGFTQGLISKHLFIFFYARNFKFTIMSLRLLMLPWTPITKQKIRSNLKCVFQNVTSCPYSWTFNFPKALYILKFSKHKIYEKRSIMGVFFNSNQRQSWVFNFGWL